jgi:hypothetical protein
LRVMVDKKYCPLLVLPLLPPWRQGCLFGSSLHFQPLCWEFCHESRFWSASACECSIGTAVVGGGPSSVCASVCVSVCASVCVSVCASVCALGSSVVPINLLLLLLLLLRRVTIGAGAAGRTTAATAAIDFAARSGGLMRCSCRCQRTPRQPVPPPSLVPPLDAPLALLSCLSDHCLWGFHFAAPVAPAAPNHTIIIICSAPPDCKIFSSRTFGGHTNPRCSLLTMHTNPRCSLLTMLLPRPRR